MEKWRQFWWVRLVSSIGQSLDSQLKKLKSCEKIFQEKASGLDSKRNQLNACLDRFHY